ncbi:MAG: RdgB/HAM1 family non-canonical purine NTP pyrophosphatase [Acidimicrobiales bacterium]
MLATANPDKVQEIRSILRDTGWRLLDRPADIGEIEEIGVTIEENALLKARTVGELAGVAAIADDTGLEVDALEGRPGVYSSRYAGPRATYHDNVVALLEEMAASGATDTASRTARFVTVACLWMPNEGTITSTGVVEGTIATSPRGNGWGYDPVFVPLEGDGRTFAEMDAIEKNAISHRGRAFRELAAMLRLPGI